jgi:hypothetical protein
LKEIEETMEKARDYAVRCIEVPPHAKFEITWSEVSPLNPEVAQRLTGKYNGEGPILIACLTD